jgi:hypothetical protein
LREEKGGRTNSPPRSVKVLAGRANRQGDVFHLGRQGRDAGKGHVVQAVVDLVGEDDDLVLEAQVGDSLKLLAREYLANGVVLAKLVFGEEGRSLEEGVRGVLRTIILVLGVIARSSSSKSMVHSPAERVLTAPSLGGCIGT